MTRRIPFAPLAVESIAAGRKTMTTRTKRYGHPGDVLVSPAGPIVLEAVDRVALEEVEAKHYRAEGFDTPDGFRREWRRLHPRNGWEPKQWVYLHRFHLLAQEGKGPG
jgi:hypothetical protein